MIYIEEIFADSTSLLLLQTLYDLYTPLLHPFLALASEHLVSLASAESSTLLYDKSLDALSWLQKPSTRPDVSYLASCAVSLPLIGLTQLAQYVVYGKGSSLGPAELGAKFKGATGHSQGIISACVVAKEYPPSKGDGSDAWEPFYQQALSGLTVLFQIGLQGTLAFPPLAIAPGLAASSVENGEGVPTAMLAVTGLELKSLEKKIAEVNGHVKAEGRDETVSVSLYNGAKAFVVTGNPKDLVGLSDALRKNRAPQGKDQSKVSYLFLIFSLFDLQFTPLYFTDPVLEASSRFLDAIPPHQRSLPLSPSPRRYREGCLRYRFEGRFFLVSCRPHLRRLQH